MKQAIKYSSCGPSLDEVLKYKPSEAEIFPTLNCSLDCEGCNLPPEYRKNWKTEERHTIKWWLKTFKELEGRGIKFVMIMGGEPFSYKDPETGEGLEEMVRYLAESKSMTGGLFTGAVIPMINSEKLQVFIDHGLLEINVHSSIDILPKGKGFKRGVKRLNREYKAWYGLEFLTEMAKKGARSIANCVISSQNISEIIILYKELRRRGVMLTLCTMHWNVHIFGQGRDPHRYESRLSYEHQRRLVDVIDELIEIEKEYISKGEARTLASSSRFLRAMSTLGIDQSLGCLDHTGKINPPGVIVVGSIMAKASGGIKYCPCMISEADLSRCPGCLYGFRDRDLRLDELLSTMGIFDEKDGKEFPNIVHPF